MPSTPNQVYEGIELAEFVNFEIRIVRESRIETRIHFSGELELDSPASAQTLVNAQYILLNGEPIGRIAQHEKTIERLHGHAIGAKRVTADVQAVLSGVPVGVLDIPEFVAKSDSRRHHLPTLGKKERPPYVFKEPPKPRDQDEALKIEID